MTEVTNLQAAIDARLSEALTAANYRITLNLAKQNARLKLQNDLTFSTNGGTFAITPELISFVSALRAMEKDDAVLLDVKQNPIQIDDLAAFLEQIVSTYYECTNEFLVEFKALNKQRTAKAVVGEQ